MSELLPCPFCGGTDLSTSLGSRVECRSCGAGGPVVITKDARIEWNRRAALPREGWKLVPVEPTDAMISAGADVLDGFRVDVLYTYDAMLAAAPPTQEEQE